MHCMCLCLRRQASAQSPNSGCCTPFAHTRQAVSCPLNLSAGPVSTNAKQDNMFLQSCNAKIHTTALDAIACLLLLAFTVDVTMLLLFVCLTTIIEHQTGLACLSAAQMGFRDDLIAWHGVLNRAISASSMLYGIRVTSWVSLSSVANAAAGQI